MQGRSYFTDLKKPLGSINGVGTVLAEGRIFGGVSYLIEVSLEQYGTIRKDGIIDAKTEILEQIHQAEEQVLTLETGEEVPIIITDIISGHAEIRIIGPMPRFARHGDVSQFSQSNIIDFANYSISPRSR